MGHLRNLRSVINQASNNSAHCQCNMQCYLQYHCIWFMWNYRHVCNKLCTIFKPTVVALRSYLNLWDFEWKFYRKRENRVWICSLWSRIVYYWERNVNWKLIFRNMFKNGKMRQQQGWKKHSKCKSNYALAPVKIWFASVIFTRQSPFAFCNEIFMKMARMEIWMRGQWMGSSVLYEPKDFSKISSF